MQRLYENKYSVTAFGKYLELEQNGDRCLFYCDEADYDVFWAAYFDVATDYGAYIASVDPEDRYLAFAADFGRGIHILRQDLWEMIVSFLISQQNNITRIRRCIENICTAYGERRTTAEGVVFYTFPAPEALACLAEDDLKACNLGYRSKYVVRTAKHIVSGRVSLEAVKAMPYEDAKAELLKLFGVGEKVADCICLFALHHLSAFPVDTHIRQALEGHYQNGFPKYRYKGFEGVMQQYIFYYELKG